MNNLLRSYALLLLTAGILVFLDQFSKYLVRTYLPLGQVFHPELKLSQYMRIVHWYNTGAAGGLLQGMNTIFAVVAAMASIIILIYYARIPRESYLLRLSMGFLLGGALGNLIDRVTQGHVTDFISVGILPVLNFADLCVGFGLVLLCLGIFLPGKVPEILSQDQAHATQQAGNEPPKTV